MKILVVLALAVFTRCDANLFHADEPKSKLDELTDAFWGYVDNAWDSEFGRNVYFPIQKAVQEMYALIPEDKIMLVYGIEITFIEGINKIKKNIVSPVTEKVHSMLTPTVEQVIEMASPYVDKLKEKLDPLAQEVQALINSLYHPPSKAK